MFKLFVLSFFLLAPVMRAGAEFNEAGVFRTGSAADFERLTRDRFVTVQEDPLGVRLARSWLIATEEGIDGRRRRAGRRPGNDVRLSAEVQVRKEFDITRPGVTGAELYMYSRRGGNTADAPKLIALNGKSLEHTELGLQSYRGWRRQPIPGEWLRAGRNLFTFSGNGILVPDPRSPVVGSRISYDGGENWHEPVGEFIIRLRVHGYPREGEATSEIIDTGRVLAPDREIGPWPAAEGARVQLEADTPEGTSVAVWTRSGSTPQFDPRTWSAWRAGKETDRLQGRYFQWRIRLSSADASLTPLVRSVEVSFTSVADVELPGWLGSIMVERIDRPCMLESSYPFTYQDYHPLARYLRDKYELESVIEPGMNDLEATEAIHFWSSRRWEDGHDSGYYGYCPPWDLLLLLDMAPDNLSLGMCTHWATTFVQSSAALGYLSRHLIVGHCMSEVFVDDIGKWVVKDITSGPDGPMAFPVARRFEKDGVPLSALEMIELWQRGETTFTAVPPQQADGEPEAYDLHHLYMQLGTFGIPLRNNHLSAPEPAEEEHGMNHFRYDGYLWYVDSVDDPPETVAFFSLLSNRYADFYPSVNRTRIDLKAMETEKDTLRVGLHAGTPNFSFFEVNINGEGWNRMPSPATWTLSEGRNTLAARAVNVFGRPGLASEAVVIINP